MQIAVLNVGEAAVRLQSFMWTVLQRLLASDSDRDVVDSAADALLPLILAFPHAFQRLGESFCFSVAGLS